MKRAALFFMLALASGLQAVPTPTPTVTVTPGSSPTPSHEGVRHEETVNLGVTNGQASQRVDKMVDISDARGDIDVVVMSTDPEPLKCLIGQDGAYLKNGGARYFYGVSRKALIEWAGGRGRIKVIWWTKK